MQREAGGGGENGADPPWSLLPDEFVQSASWSSGRVQKGSAFIQTVHQHPVYEPSSVQGAEGLGVNDPMVKGGKADRGE